MYLFVPSQLHNFHVFRFAYRILQVINQLSFLFVFDHREDVDQSHPGATGYRQEDRVV